MNQAAPRAPARILKGKELAVAQPRAVAHAPVAPGALPAAGPQACAEKSARLVASAAGQATIEVRCSCGEVTRVELRLDGEAGKEVSR